MWSNYPATSPETGRIVNCRLSHFSNKKNTQEHLLKKVNEDDCDWRTADDNSELSYDWTVTQWFDDVDK